MIYSIYSYMQTSIIERNLTNISKVATRRWFKKFHEQVPAAIGTFVPDSFPGQWCIFEAIFKQNSRQEVNKTNKKHEVITDYKFSERSYLLYLTP